MKPVWTYRYPNADVVIDALNGGETIQRRHVTPRVRAVKIWATVTRTDEGYALAVTFHRKAEDAGVVRPPHTLSAHEIDTLLQP